jgi:hypothetical protein
MSCHVNDDLLFAAWIEYMALSDPSSESDNSEADPSYEPGDGVGDEVEPDDIGGNEDDGSADNGDDDGSEDNDDEVGEEEDDDEEEEDYDPTQDDDEDDDDEYFNGLALLPPLPPGTEYWNGVTVVHRVAAIRDLRPEFHILGFGPNLTIHQRIRLWATGDAMGFDFQPTEMLRYVWRLELLLNGENPGNPDHYVNEPPVPNPGDYEEGWMTDEEMEEEDLGSDMEVD